VGGKISAYRVKPPMLRQAQHERLDDRRQSLREVIFNQILWPCLNKPGPTPHIEYTGAGQLIKKRFITLTGL